MARLVLACALLMRLLVPAGWMPASGAHGLSIRMCTGMGAQSAGFYRIDPVDARLSETVITPNGKKSSLPPGAPEGLCAFAGLGQALLQAPGVAFAALSPIASPGGLLLFRLTSPGRGLVAPPPPSTGPPFRS